MIEADGLTKCYGATRAVDGLSFTVRPGRVTGFLGPNGAGKSTTMRMILGLDRPDAGRALVNGRPHPDHRFGLRQVGALLDPRAFHGGRSGRDHLQALAESNGIPRSRVAEVLRTVGLQDAGRRRAGGYSLGMGQRLGIAAALLGDPPVLMFDEPVNGLDPEGILWVRDLLRNLAGEGRTVFVSSHLMTEMAQAADHLIVIGRGRLIADASVTDFVNRSGGHVRLRAALAADLVQPLTALGGLVDRPEGDVLVVSGLEAAEVGRAAQAGGVALEELVTVRPSLEEVFMAATQDSVEYRPTTPSALEVHR